MMRFNPYQYGNETWNIGDKVNNFTVKRPKITGKVTNLAPASNGREFLVYVMWETGAVSSHLNGDRLTKI
jgi:hypothetical protein